MYIAHSQVIGFFLRFTSSGTFESEPELQPPDID